MRGLRSGHPLNMQCFVYYRTRSIPPGALSRAYEKIGGITGQLNLLGIVLRRAIVESPFAAMEYGRVIHIRFANMARERYREGAKFDFLAPLSTEQTEVARNIATASNAYVRAKALSVPPLKRRFDADRVDNGRVEGTDLGQASAVAPAPGVLPKVTGAPPPKNGKGWRGKNTKTKKQPVAV